MILSLDSLNLIIAVSAVLISAASFIATYIQSEASLKQVKAETWPYLQIDTGNYDSDARERIISFKVENAGVGPADLKQFELYYEGKLVRSIVELVNLCCQEQMPAPSDENPVSFTTDSPSPAIIPAGDDRLAFTMPYSDYGAALWTELDKARWKLKAHGCYCSLLGDCFETDFNAEPREVARCIRDEEREFNG